MRLYKYCDAGGIEILRSNSIKVSSPSEFNDPFDCNPIPDTTTPASREALKAMIKAASDVWKSLSRGITPPGIPIEVDLAEVARNFELILENRLSNTREVHNAMMLALDKLAVLCLSAQRNNHLMWAHYGDRHRGLVIEVESEGIFEIGDDSTVHKRLLPVQYSDYRPFFRFDSVLAPDTYTTKGKAWSYEEEWRIIHHQKEFISRIVGGRELHLLPLPPENIRSVLLGSKMPDSHRREVRRLLSDGHYNHVQLVQTEMDPLSYVIREVPVTFV